MLKVKFQLRQFNADLKKFRGKVESSLDQVTKEASEKIVQDAKFLDSDVPEIANSINYTKNANGIGYIITKGDGMNNPMFAYSEFGTGNYAALLLGNYPEEWRIMAMQFFVNGKGRLPSKPALYPAFVKNTVNIADNAAKKING